MAASNLVAVRVGATGFRAEITARGHALIADEPTSMGGTDEGPTPYDYLVAGLGACTAMTLRLIADRRGWPLDEVVVRLSHGREHEKDCEECEGKSVGIERITRSIDLVGNLTPEQREALLRIANRCPVEQTLARGIEVVDG